MLLRFWGLSLFVLLGFGQEAQPPQLKQRGNTDAAAVSIAPGTHILLNMINSVSTKQALVGDRIYLETAFPVIVAGKIVVPQGSWVTGTVTQVTRPKRVKGRGALQVRFDSLTLPNGVSRDFRSDLGAIDSRENQTLKREGSTIEGSGKSGAGTVVAATAAGAAIGSGIGSASGSPVRGAGIGAGSGLAAGLIGVLLTRSPDATLTKGSTVEMILDRPLSYQEAELDFRNAPPRPPLSQGGGSVPAPVQRRWPF